ncbi:unnamed protein product [Aphanomyces euteiches]
MATTPSSFEVIRRKCLDAAWVANVSATLGIDPNARDSQNRLVYPWLRPSLPAAKFKINDDRQYLPTAFQPACFGGGEALHGVGETIFVSNSSQANRGKFQGTFVMEWNGWTTHALTSMTLSILLQEMLGYDVSYFETAGGTLCTQRMSSVRLGTCVPTHFNAEVWSVAKLGILNVYANESTWAGNGYTGLSGWYTLTANVQEALKGPNSTRGSFQRPYSADFWHEYIRSNDLINFYSVTKSNLSALASSDNCADGTMGCNNGCSKSRACILAEAQGTFCLLPRRRYDEARPAGQPCMLVLMMYTYYDPGFLESALSNNDVPAYFCFAGYSGLQDTVVDIMNKNGTVMFYHYEPDLFHLQHDGLFTRIALPKTDPYIVAQATGSFGETSTQRTSNPINVDFPYQMLMKYSSKVVNQDRYLANFLGRFQITQLDINALLGAFALLDNDPAVADPTFATSCKWIQANYMLWKDWIDRLPLCTVNDHMQFTITGCNNTNDATSSFRNVSFAWTTPDPTNASLPYTCDGGLNALPPPILTSRSCEWLHAGFDEWIAWIKAKPVCDSSYYNYTVSSCDANAQRMVKYAWFLPQLNDSTKSIECVGGVALPASLFIRCDYIPTDSSAYTSMMALAVILIVVIVLCAVGVVFFRKYTVIKRAQWPLLLTMLLGGFLLCVYVLVGGGAPTASLCGSRPVLVVLGYTLIFGSLFVKSLRVYWIFSNKSLKKVTVSLWKIVKILLVLLGIEIVILFAWLASDFPLPTVQTKPSKEFVGTVNAAVCRSSSFIFSALLIFWKAVITFGGLYMSFLIRNAGSDFQESVWIFASSCIVMVGALILLPMAYLTELSPTIEYTFQSVVILLGTVRPLVLVD